MNGQAILGWQICALLSAGVHEIIIVTGAHDQAVRDYVNQHHNADGARVRFVLNKDYAATNNMYSLYLCRELLADTPFLLLNGDVVFDPQALNRLLAASGSAICVDEGSYDDESMKVIRAPGSADLLGGISKDYPSARALGCSIDLYRFDRQDGTRLLAECGRIIEREHQVKLWTEVALHRLLETGGISCTSANVSDLDWFEIDTPEDLQAAELLFTATTLRRNPPAAYLVDLDGTLFVGSRPVPGAAEFIAAIRRQGVNIAFLSNNSSGSHAEYVQRLASFGIASSPREIILSTDGLGSFLQAKGLRKPYVLGTDSMKAVLAAYGVHHETANPDAVVLGFHTGLQYNELASAALWLQRGLPYYASHNDRACPTERGLIPDAGAIAELLYITTGRKPEQSFGKPSVDLLKPWLHATGVPPSSIVVIGDRVYTDAALASNLGARFVGVLSGESSRADYEILSQVMVVPSVGHLAESWRSLDSASQNPSPISPRTGIDNN